MTDLTIPLINLSQRPVFNIKESDGTGVSCLKSSKWLGDIADMLFKADSLKGTLGWNTLKMRKTRGTLLKNNNTTKKFGTMIEGMNRKNIKTLISNRHSNTEAKECEDNTRAIEQLYNLIYSSHSPLALIPLLQDKNSLTTQEQSILNKFNNLSEWGTDLNSDIRTTGIKYIFSLEDLYLITAVIETHSDKMAPVDKEQMRSKLSGYKLRSPAQAGVIDRILDKIDKIDTAKIIDYSSVIPIGSHIGYTFMRGAIHHGVYIGNNVVVELIQLDTKEKNKNVKPFIALTHIFDFLKRARNSGSGLLKIQYTNTYPPDVIKRRALWILGRTTYHISEDNCENVASWVMSNKHTSAMCTITNAGKIKNDNSKPSFYTGGKRKTRKCRN